MIPLRYLLSRSFFLFVSAVICFGFYGSPYAEENAYYDLGVFAYEDGDFSEAVKFFIQALAKDPENPRYNHYMGKTCLKTGKYKEAKQYLQNALNQEPDHTEARFDLAMAEFNTGNHSSAAALFSGVVDEEPSDTLARYYLAMCKFKLAHYRTAAELFVEAAEGSSSIKPNCYYYAGICYLKNGRPKDAVNKFEYVIDHAESFEVKMAADKWLTAARQIDRKSNPYRLYLKLGARYDDNVSLEPLDIDAPGDEGDIAAVGFLSGTYELFKHNRLAVHAGYNHYQTCYADLSEYDLTACSPEVSFTYQVSDRSDAVLSYMPTWYRVDSDNYMLQHYVKPEVSLNITPDLSGKVGIDYIGKNNFGIPGRRGHAAGLSADLFYLFREHDISVSAGASYLSNSPADSRYDYSEFETRIRSFFQIPWNVTLSVAGKYRPRDYSSLKSSPDLSRKREDTKYQGSASASRWFMNEKIALILEYSHSLNDSNIADYEYRKNAVTLSAATKF